MSPSCTGKHHVRVFVKKLVDIYLYIDNHPIQVEMQTRYPGGSAAYKHANKHAIQVDIQ